MPAGGPLYVPPSAGGGGASNTLYDAKGDILVGSADDTPAKLSVGNDHLALMANSDETLGLLYGAPQDLQRKYTSPANALETVPRSACTAAGQTYMVSGRVQMTALALPKGFDVGSITFVSSSSGVSAASHCWFFLTDESYTQLRATTDDTASSPWSANTAKTLGLSSVFTTTYEGLYYVGCCVVGTVGTTCVNNANVAGLYNIDPAPSIAGLTGQTTPTSDGTNMAPSPAKFGYVAYAYVTAD